jgi:hypothetical protein
VKSKRSLFVGWGLIVAGIAILLTLFMSPGCKNLDGSGIPNSLPAVGTNVEKSLAHVESADRLTKATAKHADPTGKELIGLTVKEHKAATDAGNDAKSELSNANTERAKLAQVVVDQGKEIIRLMGMVGYKVQMFLTGLWHKLLWILGTAIFLHVAFGLTGLFVAGPTGAIFARLGVLVNPFAWFQTIRDNIHFNRVINARTLPEGVGIQN